MNRLIPSRGAVGGGESVIVVPGPSDGIPILIDEFSYTALRVAGGDDPNAIYDVQYRSTLTGGGFEAAGLLAGTFSFATNDPSLGAYHLLARTGTTPSSVAALRATTSHATLAGAVQSLSLTGLTPGAIYVDVLQVIPAANGLPELVSNVFSFGPFTVPALPDLTLTESTIVERAAAGSAVGVLSGVPEGATVTLPGTDGGRFALAANQRNIVAGLTQTVYSSGAPTRSITARWTLGAISHDTTFTIAVTDVAEAATLTATGTSSGLQAFRPGLAVSDGQLRAWGTVSAFFNQVAADGIEWVRTDFRLHKQSSGGAYNWTTQDETVNAAAAAGIQLLGIIMPGGYLDDDFDTVAKRQALATYAADLATRYPAIKFWELLNEPNLGVGGSGIKGKTTPANYTALLKLVHPALKAARPDTTLLVGGFACALPTADHYGAEEYLTAIYADGGKPYIDGVSGHIYDGPLPPLNVSDQWHATEIFEDLIAVMDANGDQAKPIWLTEFGDTTGGTGGNLTTEAEQLTALQSMYRAFTGNGLGLIKPERLGPLFYYEWRDQPAAGTSTESYFGLLRADGTPKPAHAFYKSMALAAAAGKWMLDSTAATYSYYAGLLFQSPGNYTLAGVTFALVSPPVGVTYDTATRTIRVNTATTGAITDLAIVMDATPPGGGTAVRATLLASTPAAAAYTPLSEATLQAWHDFTDQASLAQNLDGTGAVTTDGTVIGYAADKSPFGRHITQGGAGPKPTWRNTGGEKFARFGGAGAVSLLNRQPTPLMGRNVGTLTLFLVGRVNATPTATINAVFLSNANFSSQARAVLRITTGLQVEAAGRRLDANNNVAFGGRAITVGQKFVFIGVFNYAGALGTTYLNGVASTATAFQTAGNTSDTEALAWCFGGQPADTVAQNFDPFEGGAMGSTDVAALNAYLMSKHGISA